MDAINEWTDVSVTNLLNSINGTTAEQLEVVKGLMSEVAQNKAQLVVSFKDFSFYQLIVSKPLF